MSWRIGAAFAGLLAIVGVFLWVQSRGRPADEPPPDAGEEPASEAAPRAAGDPDAVDADGWPSIAERPWDVRWRAPAEGADGGPFSPGRSELPELDVAELSALTYCRRDTPAPEAEVECDEDSRLLRLEEDKTGDGAPEIFVLTYEGERLVSQTEDVGGDGTIDHRTTFSYDDEGRPTGHEMVDPATGEVLGAQRVRYPEPGRVELWMESPGPIGVTMIQVFVGEQLVEHYQQQHGE